MSWLWLSDKPRTEISSNAQQQSAQASPRPDQSQPASQQGAQDNEHQQAKGANNLDTSAIMKDKMAGYHPHMPALFGTDLPPCGPDVQVAYSNVNALLRQRWIYYKGAQSASNICHLVKAHLHNQNEIWPPFFSRSETKHRQPWRRENVFQYELRWIDYFVRESQAPEPMTESEIIDRAKESSIPKELRITCNRNDVLQLWDAWHEKKRARTPTTLGAYSGSGTMADLPEDTAAPGENRDTKRTDPAEIVIAPSAIRVDVDIPPEFRTRSKSWSQGDHD